MNVTSKIKMDLTKPNVGLALNAVQGDAYSRRLCLSLYNGVSPWKIPEGTTAAVRYSKPDHTKGYYDTMPDGTSAWSFQENILTVQLAPQMLTVAGKVTAQIELIHGTHTISTFRLTVYVEPNPAAGVLVSEDYINWLQWIQDQTSSYKQIVQQSAKEAQLAAQTTHKDADTALEAVRQAETAASESAASAESAENARKNAAGLLEEVTEIVYNHGAYTKEESDFRFGSAVVQTASGETISVSDSVEAPLAGLKVFGKTTQNGTPSPDTPMDFVHAGQEGSISVSITGSEAGAEPQTFTFATPNGLAGIPVDSGGNYTDASGQQWICDEIDFAERKYIQRIGYVKASRGLFYLAENSGYPVEDSLFFCCLVSGETLLYKNALCSKLPYNTKALNTNINGFYTLNRKAYCRIAGISDEETFNNLMDGAEFAFILPTPVETELSEEALLAYRHLRMQQMHTTLTNNNNAHLEIDYVADTKSYIDAKFSALFADGRSSYFLPEYQQYNSEQLS